MAKGQIGKQIKYTRIVIGDGFLPPDTTPRYLKQVVSPVISLPILKLKINKDGTVTVGTVFTNADLESGFFYRELALYADDPDEGEILYCYGNAGDFAEWIAPSGSGNSTIKEKQIDIVTVIGNAVNVTANLDSNSYAVKSDIENLQRQIDEIKLGGEISDEIKAQIAEAVQKANEAYNLATNLRDTLTYEISDIATKVNRLEDSVFNNLTANPFEVTFENLDGLVVTGVWNKLLRRVEC